MEEIIKWKLLSIVMSFFFLSTLVIAFELNSRNDYTKELDLINSEFASLGLETPQWNETTRYFEMWDGSTAYIGYTRFNDMDTNLIEIVKFDECEVVKLNGKYQYTATDENINILVSDEVQRRFLKNE